jgi:short-subunit dehydrogenase
MVPERNYALVTGASSGLGWHLSELLAQKGYHLIAASNEPEGLDQLKMHLVANAAIKVFTVNINLAGESSARALFDYCEKLGLTVEVLVNNAGMLAYGEAYRIPYAEARDILQLHVTTPALLCRLFSDKMIKNGKGFILNVSSISAVMPFPTISFYGPTKTFLRHFTRALRTELKGMGLHVTCLLPGAMDTRLLDRYHFNRRVTRRFRILLHPREVAQAGIKALFRNRPECIPGWLNKLVVWILPVIPRSIIALIYRNHR